MVSKTEAGSIISSCMLFHQIDTTIKNTHETQGMNTRNRVAHKKELEDVTERSIGTWVSGLLGCDGWPAAISLVRGLKTRYLSESLTRNHTNAQLLTRALNGGTTLEARAQKPRRPGRKKSYIHGTLTHEYCEPSKEAVSSWFYEKYGNQPR